jgi:hypothetical protein
MTRGIPSLALLAASWTAACGGAAGGPQLAELESFVVDAAGNRTEPHCTVVPVLRGGRAVDDIHVKGEFSMRVDASPDLVVLTFGEVADPEDLRREIEADELKTGYAEELDVTTVANRRFIVFLNSRCQ